jgi:rubrerythrin
LAQDPKTVIEKALKVAIRVEEREYKDIYPSFRDQALKAGNHEAASVYQRVIDSEEQHAQWFHAALKNLQSQSVAA